MKATAAMLLSNEDYPDELIALLADMRELSAEGGPHYARVDRAEFERFLDQLRARRIGGEGNPAPP